MNELRDVVPGEFYRHFKNKLYQIRCIAYNSETNDKMVVYQAMYGDFLTYVRPFDMFVSEVDHVKYPEAAQKYRFEKVDIPMTEPDEKQHTDISRHTGIVEVTRDSDVYDDYEDEDQNTDIDSRLVMFLDAENYQDKLNVLTSLKSNMDDRLINDIAMAMDVIVPEGTIDSRYESLKSCIIAHVKYEHTRI